MVYDQTKSKFEQFIEALRKTLPVSSGPGQYPELEFIQPQVEGWIEEFFVAEEDNIGNCLDVDIERIARHVAEKMVPPTFHAFEEQKRHNIDALAKTILRKTFVEADEISRGEFAEAGSLCRSLQVLMDDSSRRFKPPMQRVLYEQRYGVGPPPLRTHGAASAEATKGTDRRREATG